MPRLAQLSGPSPGRKGAAFLTVVAELLDRFEREFETERRVTYGLDLELEQGCTLSRPSIFSWGVSVMVSRKVRRY